jgi:hypothetical protein
MFFEGKVCVDNSSKEILKKMKYDSVSFFVVVFIIKRKLLVNIFYFEQKLIFEKQFLNHFLELLKIYHIKKQRSRQSESDL